MALTIKSLEVEKLVAALAEMTGESKTETVRRAHALPALPALLPWYSVVLEGNGDEPNLLALYH